MKSYLSLIPISAKVRKRQNRMTMLCIIISVLLVTAIFSMADMGIRMEKKRVTEEHGSWHIMLKEPTEKQIDQIAQRTDVAAVSHYDALNVDLSDDYTIQGKTCVIAGGDHSILTEIYDDAQVISIGEPEVLVEYDDNSKNKILEALKVAAVCILIFFGSAFTIMAFNNDISISGVFEHFYKQIMGVDKPQVSVLEVFYCIGLAVGIILFFNHIGKRKLSDDVTPIQVEMDKHNKDTWNTIIDKVKEKQDV